MMVTGDAAKDAMVVAARKVHADAMVRGFNPPHITVDPVVYIAAWVDGKLKMEKMQIPPQVWANLHPAHVLDSMYPKENTNELTGFLGMLFSGEMLSVPPEHKRTGEMDAILPTTTRVGRLTIGILAETGLQVSVIEREGDPAPEVYFESPMTLGPVGKALTGLVNRVSELLNQS